MKALTIWQPWASLIVHGFKVYEFRGNASPRPRSVFNQRVVIHAGRIVAPQHDWFALLNDDNRLAGSTGLTDEATIGQARTFLSRMAHGAEPMPRGAGIGSAIFGQPKRCTELFADKMDARDIAPDMWGWPLSAVERWEKPLPASGAQGFWDWSSGDVAGDGHRCHAQGCTEPVPPKMLMCLRHWRMVPRAIQREVWRTYRPGQEHDKQPSDAYLMAARHAIEVVADREKVLL